MGDGILGTVADHAVEQAHLGAGAARLQLHDPLRQGRGGFVAAAGFVQVHRRFQRLHVVRLRRQPALDHRQRAVAGFRFEGQPQPPQRHGFGMFRQRGVEGAVRVLDVAGAAPDVGGQAPGARVARLLGHRLAQQRDRALMAAHRQFDLGDHAPKARGRRGGIVEQRLHRLQRLVRALLLQQDVGEQTAQALHARHLLDDPAEGLLGEGVIAPGQMGEAQRVQHHRVVGPLRRGLGQQGLRAFGIAAAQRDHALQHAHPRMLRLQPRRGALQALGFVDVAATDRHLAAHDVGLELVGVEIDGAVERGAGLVQTRVAEQEPGALQVDAGVFRRQQHRAVDRVQRRGAVAVAEFGLGQQGMGAGVVRGFGDGQTGQRHGFGVGAALQGGDDLFEHGEGSGRRGLGPEPPSVPPAPVAPPRRLGPPTGPRPQPGSAADSFAVTQPSA